MFLTRNVCFSHYIDPQLSEIHDRQEDLAVDFLFWSDSMGGGSWTFDWSTWTWNFSGKSPTFTVRFDTTVGSPSFEELFKTENADKFKPGGKTKVIIHGFTENGSNDWNEKMAKTYFDTDPGLNVISVEWSQLAEGPDYPPAAGNTQTVGEHVGNFINYMISRSDPSISLSDVHIVGFSLGAQVAGKAGATLKSLNSQESKELGRITGLDPAEEFFAQYEGVTKDKRLDSSDAKFVDVIHTSANTNPNFSHNPIGNKEKLGHLDFWPNGGNTPMPGTEFAWFPGVESHFRAVEYFIESISNPSGFPARKANSYEDFKNSGGCDSSENMMGEAAKSNGPNGNYYLDTNAHHPYAKGQTCS